MRSFLHTLVAAVIMILAAACVLAPDSFSVGSRVDRYGRYDSTTFTALFRNPWKHQRVIEEAPFVREGIADRDAP